MRTIKREEVFGMDIEEINDIPEVTISREQKFINWYFARKDAKMLKKAAKETKKEEKRVVKAEKANERKEKFLNWRHDISEAKMMKKAESQVRKENKRVVKIEKANERKERFLNWRHDRSEAKMMKKAESQVRKENKRVVKAEKANERKENKHTIKIENETKKLIASYAGCILKGACACLSFGGALVAASAVLTIGLIPALVSASLLAGSYKAFAHFVKQDVKKISEINSARKEKSAILTNDQGESFYELTPREIKKKTIAVENLIVASDCLNVKLTKEDKMARVKAETRLARIRVNNVTSYCIFVAKDDIKLQKFIRSEYRKENPEEKIQSFEMGNEKVLVLANRPNFK